ncbi:MAG: TIGR00300 family protein [Planctomycetes bacterium]|nr:TIGR00300 family protein [Planctomycetota bacterium]
MVHEEVELRGHVLDSLTLSKVLDAIIQSGGTYEVGEFRIGKTRAQPSRARLWVSADDRDALDRLLKALAPFGVRHLPSRDADLRRAPAAGVAPDGFAVSTNLPTEIRLKGRWVPVVPEEMDRAIVVSRDMRSARPVPLYLLKKGDLVVYGRRGIRVASLRPAEGEGARDPFAFLSATSSAERPARPTIRALADAMEAARRRKGKILFVAGPAIVHSGGARALTALIRAGWVSVLFAGNALATHDLEASLYGTSLGMDLAGGVPVPHGHTHHLRAINAIRRAGSIAAAVKRRLVKRGIMYALVTARVPFVLAGSIRDDGPLPDVISDARRAQEVMRAHLAGVEVAVMVATALHAVATGNLLPARVRTVMVDIDAARVTELTDRGTAQAKGIVMDAASFLSELARALGVRGGS